MYDREPQLPQEIVPLSDPRTGLSGVIVIHSTRLGPAAGGCRFWPYPSDQDAAVDALRLAEGMSYKNALADLPLGGGKAVLRRPSISFDRQDLFEAFGRAVASLRGRYVTAEDVGTGVDDMLAVARQTQFVAGLPRDGEAPGGDPSPWTALGVFQAMEAAVRRRLDAGLSDVTVGIQGLGNVGFALCGLLHEAGARLVVAEPRHEVAVRAVSMFGAEVMTSDELLQANLDVFAPCALGGAIDKRAVGRLQAKVVCGAANNQLTTPQQGFDLARRGILYAPDYVVNAGGIINVAAEYLGWEQSEVRRRIGEIGPRLEAVLDHAEAFGLAPHEAADSLARSIIADRARREIVTA